MKKTNIIYALVSLLIMVGLPWLATTFANSDWGMLVCMLLFFAVDPILSVCIGIFTGENFRTAWYQPLLCAAFFLVGAWLFLDAGETVFLGYAGVYVTLSYLAAAITIRRKI